jgi:parvulin-like peptidyl-prolyl isomerase
VRVLIRSTAAIVLFLIIPAGHSQTKPSPQKAPAGSSAPVQGEPAKEAEEVIPPAAPDALFPAVVARVNGKAILGRDLEQRVQSELSTIGSPPWKNLREDYRQGLVSQMLGTLIANELLYQKGLEGGMKATEAEVQAEVAKMAKTFSSDAEMNMQLASRGMDRAGLSKELSKGLVVTKVIEENIAKKIVISPEDAQKYYSAHPDEFHHPDLVRTSHILIRLPEGATADQDRIARQRAEALLERARKGEDFARLAKENSMDGSASQGGDIGFTARGMLAPEYEQAAFSLPVGSISDVVHTQFGYHVIKVTEIKKEGISPIEEVRSSLTDFLKNQKVQEELGKFVTDLRNKAKIEVYLPPGVSGPTASSPHP